MSFQPPGHTRWKLSRIHDGGAQICRGSLKSAEALRKAQGEAEKFKSLKDTKGHEGPLRNELLPAICSSNSDLRVGINKWGVPGQPPCVRRARRRSLQHFLLQPRGTTKRERLKTRRALRALRVARDGQE